MKNNIEIMKFDNKYVGEDCAQIMIPYTDTMSIFDNSEIIFHAKNTDDIDINNYLDDERRIRFPYQDIHYHYTKHMIYVNQIFNLDKSYLIIRNGLAQQCNIFKFRDNTFILLECVKTINHTKKYMNSEEIRNFLKDLADNNNQNNEKICALDENGNFLNFLSKEQRLLELDKFIDYLEENNLEYKYDGYHISYEDVPDKSKIPKSIIPINSSIFIVKTNGDEIKTKLVKIYNNRRNNFELNCYDLVINKITNKQILEMATKALKTLKEPKISRRYNKDINKSLILSNKNNSKNI